ncbi:AAA-domain-containing protein, partial [Pluteus cervinus]
MRSAALSRSLLRSSTRRSLTAPLQRPLYSSSLRRTRFASTSAAPPTNEPDTENLVEQPKQAQPPDSSHEALAEEVEKPKTKRTRITVTTKEPDPVELPEGLDVLWDPDQPSPSLLSMAGDTELPPPQILQEALNNLHLTLHPHTQHRATYPGSSDSLVEPTLALYCPIEGGEYVIDATVWEMARKTGSEVVVIDAAHLAAGEWGHFGQAASSIQLPRNPLHFHANPSASDSDSAQEAFDGDEEPDSSPFFQPSQMTLVMAPSPSNNRAIISSSRRSSPPSRIKVFFDSLVNTPSKSPPSTAKNRPRLIYIRDFPTLAASAPTWYPPLLSAVRQRRRGPISRPTSPINNPITIIFGMTPSIVPPPSIPSNGSSGIMGMLMNRNASPASFGNSGQNTANSGKPEWTEEDGAEKAREKRLRERLKKWEKGDASLLDEISSLTPSADGETGGRKPDIIVVGVQSRQPALSSLFGAPNPSATRPTDSEVGEFFRTSILVPVLRSLSKEKETRIARRREINALTMRMAIGAVGGRLDPQNPNPPLEGIPEPGPHEQMWQDWANKVELWPNVKQTADHAVGTILSQGNGIDPSEKLTLDRTIVDWPAVSGAWSALRQSEEVRKSWTNGATSLARVLGHDDGDGAEAETAVDEVIERIRNSPDLEPHEQRLLSCIVDSKSMTTSFSQVHLPTSTVDSVRTIVSLPLLYPQAFQHGILKEHSMNGVLLFGPPGTGKTLVARALAKEAGCRMMVVSPSDVMDMYVGEGEKLVRAVFSLARKLSPCVVFLDEIDALFGARISSRESGGAIAHRGVITEFMQEMDGLKTSKEDRVIVIGATNRPFDLDDAVLRRLPRRLLVDLPGPVEREEILKILLRDETLAEDVSLANLAKQSETFSGSDLKHLCVAAALDAVKEHAIVPWVTNPSPTSETASEEASTERDQTQSPTEVPIRKLHQHNFVKALQEITPSSSEILGSLAELRKWNEEFGEGRRNRKRQQVWGKGSFGFTTQSAQPQEEGKVLYQLNTPHRQDTDASGV